MVQAIAHAHELGLALVVKETPLDYSGLPTEPIYTIAQILDPDFPTYHQLSTVSG